LSSRFSSFFSSPRNVIRVVAVVLLIAGTYGQLMLSRDSAPVAGSKQLYDVAMTFTTPAGKSQQRAQARDGQSLNVSADDKLGKLTAAFSLAAAGADAVKLEGAFGCGGASAPAAPLTARFGAPAMVKRQVESSAPACQLEVVVTKLAEASSAR
jgi:hypothetical protein